MKKKTTQTPSIEWEDITPVKAQEYLARNSSNRNLRESTVKAYERDMRAGNWVPTHQGIAFNDRGDLIDGQHRLSAIVRSGSTVRMLVTRGIPRQSGKMHTMDAVDRGAARSVADQLRVQHGYTNATQSASVATAIANLCVANVRRVTVAQTLGVLEIYGRQIDDVFRPVNSTKEKRLRRSQFMAALAFARAVDPHAVDQFLQGMITGAGLAVDSPVLLLRNFLFSDASIHWTSSGLRDQRTDLALLVLNSLVQFVEGATASKLLEGRRGFVHFAALQKENVDRVARIFFAQPVSLEKEKASAKPISIGGNAPRHTVVVRSAADVQLTPLAESLIAGKDRSDRLSGRAAKMEKRIARGEISGAIK